MEVALFFIQLIQRSPTNTQTLTEAIQIHVQTNGSNNISLSATSDSRLDQRIQRTEPTICSQSIISKKPTPKRAPYWEADFLVVGSKLKAIRKERIGDGIDNARELLSCRSETLLQEKKKRRRRKWWLVKHFVEWERNFWGREEHVLEKWEKKNKEDGRKD